MQTKSSLLICFLTGAILISACGPSIATRRAIRNFHAGEYEAASKHFRKLAKKQNKNFALNNLRLGSSALHGNELEEAERAFLNATDVMTGSAGQKRGTLSLISAESIKVFKGEPFEKAMAYVYLGIIYFNRADYENARAAFNKALLMDKQSAEKHREDMRLVFFLLAKTLLNLGDVENAKVALRKARGRLANSPYPKNRCFDLKTAKENNALFLVEIGIAPKKYRYGPGASLDDFEASSYPDRVAVIDVNGKKIGKTSVALDLLHEAKTRGSSGKDAVQATKGVARDAALVTAAVSDDERVQAAGLLFFLFNQSQADIRQWELLPAEIHLTCKAINPGSKNLGVNFFSRGGRPLTPLYQLWPQALIPKQQDQIFLLRSKYRK